MGSAGSLKQGRIPLVFCSYEFGKAGLSYLKIKEDVKKNIINIIIINGDLNYLKDSIGYSNTILTLASLGAIFVVIKQSLLSW